MSEVKHVFGIDLGTTYSAIAYVDDDGMPIIVKNIENLSLTLPSVVYIEDDGSFVVGIEAKRNLWFYPDRTFSEIKRFMGRPDYVPREIDGTTYTPEYVSSIILKKIAQYASSSLGMPVEDVVITVPAYFNQSETYATRKAVEIAGLYLIGIIPEPIAAAIYYRYAKDLDNQTVLIFDLGGGTFDVTIIKFVDDSIRIVMTGGDFELGGRRWDQAIVNYVVDKFKSEHGIDLYDDENREAYQDLLIRCEEAKITLTNRNSTYIMINCGVRLKIEVTRELFDDLTSQLCQGTIRLSPDLIERAKGSVRMKVEVTRELFNELTSMLCQRTIQLSKDLLTQAKNEKGLIGIDAILLAGGATLMPQIAKAIIDEFGIEPIIYDPETAVAKGAALFAQLIKHWVPIPPPCK